MGNGVKVQVENIQSTPLIHSEVHPVAEGDQVSQTGPAFHKPMLAGPGSLTVLYMPCDGTQEDLLHAVIPQPFPHPLSLCFLCIQ